MHTRHVLHLHRVTRSGCNRVCVRLRREWVLEELYIEGLRSASCAAHGLVMATNLLGPTYYVVLGLAPPFTV